MNQFSYLSSTGQGQLTNVAEDMDVDFPADQTQSSQRCFGCRDVVAVNLDDQEEMDWSSAADEGVFEDMEATQEACVIVVEHTHQNYMLSPNVSCTHNLNQNEEQPLNTTATLTMGILLQPETTKTPKASTHDRMSIALTLLEEARYSEDLDLFTQAIQLLEEEVKEDDSARPTLEDATNEYNELLEERSEEEETS